MNNYIFKISPETQKLISMVKATNRQTVINKCYGQIVDNLVRQRYSQSQVEAILNNYVEDMTNVKHHEEFMKMSEYRKACKNYAKELLGI